MGSYSAWQVYRDTLSGGRSRKPTCANATPKVSCDAEVIGGGARARNGSGITIDDRGNQQRAKVATPVFYDPGAERMRA